MLKNPQIFGTSEMHAFLMNCVQFALFRSLRELQRATEDNIVLFTTRLITYFFYV